MASATLQAPRTVQHWADETAFDLFARSNVPPVDVLPSCLPAGLSVGQALEICGEPATGKTATLMECAIHCILPTTVGGAGASAVVLDTDNGFSVLRLDLMLRLRLEDALHGRSADAIELEVDACLDRLYVVRCLTPRELVLALCALRFRLEAMSPTPSAAAVAAAAAAAETSKSTWDALVELPRVLLIDNLSAFQWLERGRKRERAEEGGETGSVRSTKSCMDDVSKVLGSLRHRLSVVWTRSPKLGHNGGLDFPAVEPPCAATLQGIVPSLRLRLRLRPRTEREVPSAPRRADDVVQLCFESMLDGEHSGGAGAAGGGGGAPAVTCS